MDAFRRKARFFLEPYENRIAIQKLRRNQPLTATDLEELQRIFTEAGVDEASMKALDTDGGLGRFVRSLVGLDREAAKQAFAGFIVGRKSFLLCSVNCLKLAARPIVSGRPTVPAGRY